MAIVRRDRPALRMGDDGTFGEPPSDWVVLNDHREMLQRAASCIGRVELEGHPYLRWAGSGVLVSPMRIFTVRSVAMLFCDGRGDTGLTLKPEFQVFFSGGRNAGAQRRYRRPVTAVRFIHPFFDVALCQLGPADNDSAPAVGDEDDELGIPLGIEVAAAPPGELVGRSVVVVGFPARDSRNEPAAVEEVYGTLSEKDLYVQPGRILGIGPLFPAAPPAIRHDCSTLAGSGGAPLLDLDTGHILGIHFAGRFLESNYAVPAWELARDRRVRAHGIHFSDEPSWMGEWVIAEVADALARRASPGEPQASSLRPSHQPAEPSPDPELHHFKQSDLYRIRDLLTAAGLAGGDRQFLLFVSMAAGFVSTLPIDGAPDVRLLTALNILNQTPKLTTGELPIRTLLFNAVENSKPRPESPMLQKYLDTLPFA